MDFFCVIFRVWPCFPCRFVILIKSNLVLSWYATLTSPSKCPRHRYSKQTFIWKTEPDSFVPENLTRCGEEAGVGSVRSWFQSSSDQFQLFIHRSCVIVQSATIDWTKTRNKTNKQQQKKKTSREAWTLCVCPVCRHFYRSQRHVSVHAHTQKQSCNNTINKINCFR